MRLPPNGRSFGSAPSFYAAIGCIQIRISKYEARNKHQIQISEFPKQGNGDSKEFVFVI
jgi:hypothetical protein